MADTDFKVLLQQQNKMLNIMQEQMALLQTQVKNMASGSEIVKSTVSVPWPLPLEVDAGDSFENMEFFQLRWQNYCIATGMSKWGPEKAEIKAGILLNAIGNAAMKKYLDFNLTESDKKSDENIFKKMHEAIVKRSNIIYSRYLFNMRSQLSSENFDDYLLSLKKLIKPCNYGNVEQEILRDRIVVGIKDGQVTKELLRKEDLNLDDAIYICRAAERASAQVADMQKEEIVNEIKSKSVAMNTPRKCKFCGGTHILKKNICPAWGKRCEECGGRNHFKKVCKKKKTINEIEEENSDDSMLVSEVRANKSSGHMEAPLLFKINNKWLEIFCTLDTGAQVCVMGVEYYKNITGDKNFTKLKPSSHKLKCFNGSSIASYGVATFECSKKNKLYKVNFHIVDVKHEPLLSEKACVALGFIKYCGAMKVELDQTEVYKIMQKYSDVFEGYGKLPGAVSLELDDSIPARIQPARRIPICLREKLKQELIKLEADGIIIKETQHTDWVNNILIVSRDSKFRICLDPIPLNKALKRPNFQFTTLDEMLPELSKAKVFSTVDAKKGFWQCSLTENSSKLTTFWTPFGRYRWLRLPFGLSPSPEIFQQQLTSLLKDLKGIEIIADDILIYGVGETIEEATIDHNIKFEKLLQRLRQVNCKLNKEKVNLLKTSVKFYGHVLTNEGLKVDESKVDAIKNMPTPKSDKDVLRFLGMVGYLSKFIHNLSSQAANLRSLTRKDVDFVWTDVEEREFQQLKKCITKLPTLQYFDVNKEVVIECDASEYGLGAALYQDNQVICFASRCLTPTEKKYAQIEKEMLAVVFACKRFNQYVAGHSRTIVKTDHRPLINIVNKPLIEAPKRLQMMLLTLQKYNVQLEFIQGKDNLVADTLSRAPVLDEPSNTYDLENKIKERKVYKLISKIKNVKYLKISDKLLEKIKRESEKDDNVTQLIKYIVNGFPRYVTDMSKDLRTYYKFKHELSTSDNFVFRNNQVLIPKNLRKEMLQKVHMSHNGTASTLRLARENMFWPGMSEDIKEYVEKCTFCAAYSVSQQKLPLICHDIPRYPFQYVSMDVFSFRDLKYLVTVDHYSDYFELDKLSTLTANEIIIICKKNFARHGIPQRICTDNATNFVNEHFKKFSEEWNFEHVTSSPHYPESNGKAESAVKIAKRLLVQSIETKQDLWYCLLHQRNVPIEMDKTSPVQKLFSRRTRTGLPCLLRHLKPSLVANVPGKIKERKEKLKHRQDKRSLELSDLKVGQQVIIQLQPHLNKRWSFGSIIKKLDTRSYIVRVENKEYRRNRIHIKPFNGNIKESENSYKENHYSNLHFTGVQVEQQENVQAPSITSCDTDASTQVLAETSNTHRRSERVRNIPEYLKDYHL